MRIIINKQTNPYFNLATEEYLLHHTEEDVFMLWQDEPCIVVGKNQNTLSEINYDYVTAHQIPVVRRLSGGGAVFHDLGNINFTFIQSGASHLFADFKTFTLPIIEVLKTMGVGAEFSGRNDLLIDGKKFSGNAQYRHKDRVLHHGTLLFSSEIKDLSQALKPKEAKFEGKGVKSVISRVTNISEHLPEPMSLSTFIERIENHILAMDPANNHREPLSSEEIKAIQSLTAEKYSSYEWNYGHSPKYNFTQEKKLPGGLLTIHLEVSDGVIQKSKIFGDFFGFEDVSTVEEALIGCAHNKDALLTALHQLEFERYFSGISREELVSVLI